MGHGTVILNGSGSGVSSASELAKSARRKAEATVIRIPILFIAKCVYTYEEFDLFFFYTPFKV